MNDIYPLLTSSFIIDAANAFHEWERDEHKTVLSPEPENEKWNRAKIAFDVAQVFS